MEFGSDWEVVVIPGRSQWGSPLIQFYPSLAEREKGERHANWAKPP